MNPYFLTSLKRAAGVYRKLFAAIGAARLDERLDPERFTPREVIAHLADWEPVFLERMKTALEKDGAPVNAYDEWQFCLDHDYASKSIEESLRAFEQGREQTCAFLEGCSADDLAKAYVHPERGVVSIKETGVTMLGHDVYHFDQLAEYLVPKASGTW